MRVSITHEHESGIIEALYGSHKLLFSVNEFGMTSKPVIVFEPIGLFQPEGNTRISAVATLEDRLTENGFSYSFKIFHNSYADKLITTTVFNSCKQLVLNQNALIRD